MSYSVKLTSKLGEMERILFDIVDGFDEDTIEDTETGFDTETWNACIEEEIVEQLMEIDDLTIEFRRGPMTIIMESGEKLDTYWIRDDSRPNYITVSTPIEGRYKDRRIPKIKIDKVIWINTLYNQRQLKDF